MIWYLVLMILHIPLSLTFAFYHLCWWDEGQDSANAKQLIFKTGSDKESEMLCFPDVNLCMLVKYVCIY